MGCAKKTGQNCTNEGAELGLEMHAANLAVKMPSTAPDAAIRSEELAYQFLVATKKKASERLARYADRGHSK
jgi:hypothetical protein